MPCCTLNFYPVRRSLYRHQHKCLAKHLSCHSLAVRLVPGMSVACTARCPMHIGKGLLMTVWGPIQAMLVLVQSEISALFFSSRFASALRILQLLEMEALTLDFLRMRKMFCRKIQ